MFPHDLSSGTARLCSLAEQDVKLCYVFFLLCVNMTVYYYYHANPNITMLMLI